MLEDCGYPRHSQAAIRQFIGDGARQLIERSLPGDAQARVDECLARFRDHYRKNLLRATRLYPGVLETLEALRPARLAVATNKPEEFSLSLLRGLEVLDRFGTVVGGDTLPVRKPDPAMLVETARRLGVAARECLMVGDSPGDVEAGRGAGMTTIAVTFGFRGADELRAARPDAVIDRFPDVLSVFRRGPRAAR
jgi:phosphoglycolate phosphatase